MQYNLYGLLNVANAPYTVCKICCPLNSCMNKKNSWYICSKSSAVHLKSTTLIQEMLCCMAKPNQLMWRALWIAALIHVNISADVETKPMIKIAVIGAGISGLCAVRHCRKFLDRVSVTVFEEGAQIKSWDQPTVNGGKPSRCDAQYCHHCC